ncbi:MAG: hypothetical protein A2020_09155 [Lentisphaerae bacterium GWF2_45_14]|nr:MAG: hypothetical protein A2020_09155 [Lentisphaerae bacterium GWF2_45_14]
MKVPLKQKAYEYVLDKIMSGSLQPGARLSEVAMAKEIGISPTPLREAYRQLASEGFVKYIPNSGIFVRDISTSETKELYETREAIESFCTGMAAMKMNRIDTAELKDSLNTMLETARELRDSGGKLFGPEQEIKYMKSDARFHLLILKSADNSIMLRTMRECHVLGRLLGFKSHKHSLRQVARTLLHHYRIYKSIKDHDSARAESAMRNHIKFSRESAIANNTEEPRKTEEGRCSEELRNFIHNIEKE